MNKLFCVLEQGKYINEELTIHNKNMFTTDFSDFYRLNWYRKDDPNADFYKKDLIWSEGRSFLYDKVPKNYKYYMFIDDDLKFLSKINNKKITELIKDFLLEYNPLLSCLYSKNWHNELVNNEYKNNSKSVFPYAGQDMETMIFSKDFADIMFPIIYHGDWGCMWYMNYTCHKLFPNKHLCFSDVHINNTRHSTNLEPKKFQHFSVDEITSLFNSHLHNHDFPNDYKKYVIQKNLDLFLNGTLSKDKINFTLKDFKKIYNTNNKYFKNRQPLLKNIKVINNGI